MEFQQEKTQVMHTPEKPGLVEKSMGGYRWSLPAKSSPEDKLLTNLD